MACCLSCALSFARLGVSVGRLLAPVHAVGAPSGRATLALAVGEPLDFVVAGVVDFVVTGVVAPAGMVAAAPVGMAAAAPVGMAAAAGPLARPEETGELPLAAEAQ